MSELSGSPPEPSRELHTTKRTKQQRRSLPWNLLFALSMIDHSRDHKQKIGEPIQIFDHDRIHFDLFREAHNTALRAPADGSSNVQQGSGVSTACEDELTQSRQFCLKSINGILKRFDPFLLNLKFRAAPALKTGIRQLRADRKQVLLNLCEHRRKLRVFQERCGGADERIQFVNIAVGFDPIIMFSNLRAVNQTRVPAVAGFGVDLVHSQRETLTLFQK